MIFDPNKIYWQAHRGGGGDEAPDNTLFSMQYGWNLGGIPEADIRLTSDNEVICLHDNTLARTTDAPPEIADLPVRELSFECIRRYDAGRKFSPANAGEKIPALREVFEFMRQDPEKLLYADIKNYDPQVFPVLLEKFKGLIESYSVASQVIVASCDYELNCRIKDSIPGIKTMQWIGKTPAERMDYFRHLASLDFAKLDLVQLHLYIKQDQSDGWIYDLSIEDLKFAVNALGTRLEVFPFGAFTQEAVKTLIDLGIRQFATDEPTRFCAVLKA